MNRFRGIFSIYALIGLIVFGLVGPANGQFARNSREIRDITRQLKNQVDNFQMGLSNQLRRRSSIPRQEREQLEDDVVQLKDKIRDFETRFQRQYETTEDVTGVLETGKQINDFINYNSISTKVDSDWVTIRGLLDRLASNYNISWNWNDPNSTGGNNYPTDYPSTGGNFSYSLTGTYQLDQSRSENTADIADRAMQRSNSRNDRAAREDLENKLEAPEQIAIDARGNQVTLATSNAQPITFSADGREQVQTTDDGRTIRVRASLRGQELIISSLGGDTDFTITFTSTENGRSMKVTRRITTPYLRQTVFAESVYQKTDSVARLGNYDPGDYSDNGGYSSNDPNDRNYPNGNNPAPGRTGDYIVPNDTILYGTLDNDIDTKVSQNNDRFRMTVQSPNAFRGAVVEGYLSGIDRSGRVSGRSEITFNFQTIRMPDGRTYDFAGTLQSVTDENGKTIKVDDEGAAKGDSQTKETVKRSGIGAGIGALIGAIAGGAKGAAIGAVIGGGAGAGSVILQGKDDLKLKAGSEISVKSSSPLR
ncbi:MAG: hypothetical protein R2747_16135 [Pyrinomonadaceae bacterium]